MLTTSAGAARGFPEANRLGKINGIYFQISLAWAEGGIDVGDPILKIEKCCEGVRAPPTPQKIRKFRLFDIPFIVTQSVSWKCRKLSQITPDGQQFDRVLLVTGILQMVLVVIRSGLFDTRQVVCYQNIQLIQCLLRHCIISRYLNYESLTPSTSRTSFYFGSDFLFTFVKILECSLAENFQKFYTVMWFSKKLM